MRSEVILVGAEWCASCKAVKEWFLKLEIPGVSLRYGDIESLNLDAIGESIASVPAFVFVVNGKVQQIVYGAMNRHNFESMAKSIWGETD